MRVMLLVDKDEEAPLAQDLEARVVGLFESRGHELEVVEVRRDNIIPCLGCFRCAKRNGVCVSTDVMTKVNESIGSMDVVCYLGRIVFGQYASTLKSCLDKGKVWKMPESRFFIEIGYGTDVTDEELATFLDITTKHHGEANVVHPLLKDCAVVFASRSPSDNDALCARLREVV